MGRCYGQYEAECAALRSYPVANSMCMERDLVREYWVQQLVDAPNVNMQGLNTRKGGSAGEHCNGKQFRAESCKEQW